MNVRRDSGVIDLSCRRKYQEYAQLCSTHRIGTKVWHQCCHGPEDQLCLPEGPKSPVRMAYRMRFPSPFF
ncbi:hypothetical protein KJE01_23690, partial [Escherichia marmotae]|uniref:hypothetical protein n=1 Tax=Escherichia marmotae TaxID=1499973 RepID=UPI0028133D83